MTKKVLSPVRLVLTLIVAACVSSCGDGRSRSPGQKFIESIVSVGEVVRPLAATSASAAAATTPVVTNDQVFAWAQLTYPDLFPGTPSSFSNIPYQGKLFTGRAYLNGNYLAVADGEAWGLGPYTNQILQNFGATQSYADQICSKVDCGRTGPANACTQTQGEALLAGTRLVASQVRSTFGPTASTVQTSLDQVVDGPTTLLGQPVVAITSTTDSGRDLSYVQANESGLIRTLAVENAASSGGATTLTVFDPPLQNSEFTLQAGQSVTKVASMATTTVGGSSTPALSTRSTTYTFEARERIDVQGRSYDTCRYREQVLGSTSVNTVWYIFGSGIPARIETRDNGVALVQRTELKSGTINSAPISPGQATMDVASANRMVTDFSYILPICTPGGTAKPTGFSAASYLGKARELRQVMRLAAATQNNKRALAYTSTKPSDQLGECGGRQTYPSYTHANGVTTATIRWDNYCSKDSDTGGTQILDGSWSFKETATPASSGPIRTRYEASSPLGIKMVNKDGNGKIVGSQIIVVNGYASTPGVPGGEATEAKPDRMQIAEWQLRNDLTGKTYRQTGYAMTSFTTTGGGEQVTMSGRGYRSNGYFDLSTSKPLITNADGDYVSGTLLTTDANGAAVVINVVPGEELQGTMTVDGQAVATAPGCK